MFRPISVFIAAALFSSPVVGAEEALRGSRRLPSIGEESWPSCVQDAVKAELWRIFEANPANKKHPQPGPAKMLRLAFHDCVRYEDGTGGCDGCLNWQGMTNSKTPSVHFDTNDHFTGKFSGIDSHNFGLQETVEALEDLYANTPLSILTKRNGKCRKKARSSLKQQGYSRADLWAFAALKAVEFSVDTTNRACDGDRMRGDDISTTQCLPNEGEPNCKVDLPPLAFHSGRVDCTPESDGTTEGDTAIRLGYATFKKEQHPSSSMNGQQVVKFMNAHFSLNSTESVALMGVHTIGRFHHEVAGFKYVWSSRGEGSLNNQYFRNLALKDDWIFFDDECNKLGGAWGERPKAKWMAKVNKMFSNSGPVQWIRESHVCPNCAMYDEREGWKQWAHEPASKQADDAKCCTNLKQFKDSQGPPKCKPDNGRQRGSSIQGDDDVGGRTHISGRGAGGCERFKFVGGRDHAALPSDIGLYIDFGDVDKDGFPIGCSNNFATWTDLKARGKTITENGNNPKKGSDRFINALYGDGALPMSFEDTTVSHQPCGKNHFQASPAEPPLYQIVEQFADNQALWVATFTAALEKMLSNGIVTV